MKSENHMKDTSMFPELPMDKLKAARPKRLIAIEFDDRSSFKTALKVALANELPYDILGEHTLLITAEDEYVFSDVPHKQPTRIRDSSEITPKERAALRRQHYFPLSECAKEKA
jgi:hypothetical protein